MDNTKAQQRYARLKKDAEASGYTLNPDTDFCVTLADGLNINRQRYGFEACPCRLVKGDPKDNMDIECPCDYRDADLEKYGACFCALYVNDKYDKNRQIPDARYQKKDEHKRKASATALATLPYPVWRCPVCGYLCAMEKPPDKCPICHASGQRFQRFL